MFKKILITSLLSISIFGVNAGVSEAASEDCLADQVNSPENEEKPAQNAEQPAPEKEAEQSAPEEEAKQPAPEEEEQQPGAEQNTEADSEADASLTADEQQMLDQVNQAREKAGVEPLKANQELTKVARVKAQDMIDNNYFSHNSPKYGSPFDMMNAFGIEYKTAGENIAGNGSVEGAHKSLMNSDGHRKNIEGSQYTEVGIAVVDGGPYGKMFVQMFKG